MSASMMALFLRHDGPEGTGHSRPGVAEHYPVRVLTPDASGDMPGTNAGWKHCHTINNPWRACELAEKGHDGRHHHAQPTSQAQRSPPLSSPRLHLV